MKFGLRTVLSFVFLISVMGVYSVGQDLPVIPNNSPRGASNLTTSGAVPYVSASGVLNQDASNFFWDATNHRLGIGTTAPHPGSQLHVNNPSGYGFGYFDGSSGGAIRFNRNGGATYGLFSDTNGLGSFQVYSYTANKAAIYFDSAGKVSIGNVAPSSLLTIYDSTASTGITTELIQAGAGQGTTRLSTWADSSGNALLGINGNGQEVVKVSSLASAATIAPTAPVTHVTGTTTVSTITAPSGFAVSGLGGCLRLVPDGLWATNTAGNIAIASTAVVSKMLIMCYDNATSKWYPSY